MAQLNNKQNKEFEKKSDLIFQKTQNAFEKLASEYGAEIVVIQTIKDKNKWKSFTVTK